MAQRRRGLGVGAVVGAVVALGLLAWMFAGGEPQVDRAKDRPGASAHGGEGTSGKRHAKKKPKKKKRERTKLAGAFGSKEACMKAVAGRKARAASAPVRVGTWNLRWFPRGSAKGDAKHPPTDVEWLACAIASLEVDVLAMQEVLQDPDGRAALLDLQSKLDALTGGKWQSDTDDCAGGGRQHVGLLYDANRVQVTAPSELAALNPTGEACGGSLRPGFAARMKLPDGSATTLVSVHFDSGQTARDFEHRKASFAALATVTSAAKRGEGVIVLGDFNTMGCKECEAPVEASAEIAALDAAASAAGLKRLVPPAGPSCSHYMGGKASLLDHVLVSSKSRDLASSARALLAGQCAALQCKKHPRGDGRPLAFDRLSDHCPVVVELGAAAPGEQAGAAPKAAPQAVAVPERAAAKPAATKAAPPK